MEPMKTLAIDGTQFEIIDEKARNDVGRLRDNKLDNAPDTWPTWTAEEQAVARERMGIITLTQEEYDLIEAPSESTIYVIVGDSK